MTITKLCQVGEHLMGNKYLEGNYVPVAKEHTITELAVTG